MDLLPIATEGRDAAHDDERILRLPPVGSVERVLPVDQYTRPEVRIWIAGRCQPVDRGRPRSGR